MRIRQTHRAAEFIRSLYAKRSRARQLFTELKTSDEYSDIQSVLALVMQTHRPFGHYPFSAPFPKQYSEFRRPQSKIPYIDIQRELKWTTAVLSVFPETLEKFVNIRQNFETAFLLADYDRARGALDECHERFGISIWLLERRCLLEEYSVGYEANAAVSAATAAASNHWLLRYFGAFVSSRADPQLSVDDFDSRVRKTIGIYYKNQYYSELKAYIAFKLNRPDENVVRHADYILAAEASAPIVDRYDTLLGILVHLACDKNQAEDKLHIHLSNLKNVVSDPVLDALLAFLLGEPSFRDARLDQNFLRVLDYYTVGDYKICSGEGIALLQEQPDCFPLYELVGKAFASQGCPWKDGNAGKSVSDLVGIKIMDVWAGSGSAEKSRQELARIAAQLPRTNLSYGLNWFCSQQQEWHGQETAINPSIVSSHLVNPRLAWQINSSTKRLGYLRHIDNRFPQSPLVQFEIQLASAPSTEPNNRKIPLVRQQWHRARALMSEQKWEEAAQLLSAMDVGNLAAGVRALTRSRLSRAKFDCLFYLKRWLACADIVISTMVEDPNSGRSLPIRKLIDAAEGGEAGVLMESIDFPLLYTFVATKQKEIYPAYDAFMFSVGASKPKELFDLGERFGTKRLLLFFANVCVPKVLARSPAFDSSEDVSLERIRICQFLASSNPTEAHRYFAEINELTQQLVIRRGVREVDSSKIFVDVEGMKLAGRGRWKHSFVRLTELAESDIVSGLQTIDTTEIIVINLTSLKKKGSDDGESAPLNIETVPLQMVTVPFAHFKELFLDIRDQFVSSNEFGLNSYLSVRIRHGTIEGQVRSSFEAANLLSQRTTSGGGSYMINRFWQEKLQDLYRADIEQFQKHLQSF
ncbi:MAG: hypothetical protein WAO00_14460, partial [Chthoniobacterales bacterium]